MGGRRTAEVAQQMSSEENEIAANEEEIELSLETEQQNGDEGDEDRSDFEDDDDMKGEDVIEDSNTRQDEENKNKESHRPSAQYLIPSLRGTLALVGNSIICRGLWAMSDAGHSQADQTSPFEFKLLKAFDGQKEFPMSGKYQGWFFLKQPPPAKGIKIDEKDMNIIFTKKEDGTHAVEGTGSNRFGIFSLNGFLQADGQIQLYREYSLKPVAQQTNKKKESEFKSKSSSGESGTAREGSGRVRKTSSSMKEYEEAKKTVKVPSSKVSTTVSAGRSQRLPAYIVKCSDLLKEISKYPQSVYFLEPVDHVKLNIPDYPQIISKPMDFGTISANLERGTYETPEQFAEHMRLVFRNAITYNQIRDHPVHVAARELNSKFEERFRQLVTQLSSAMVVGVTALGQYPPEKLVRSSSSSSKKSNFKSPRGGWNKGKLSSTPSNQRMDVFFPPAVDAGSATLLEMQRRMQEMHDEITFLRTAVRQNEVLTNLETQRHAAREPLSFEEKRLLIGQIHNLPSDKMGRVIEIIQAALKPGQRPDGNDEIEIPVDALDTLTLRKLQQYVEDCTAVKKRPQSLGAPKNSGPLNKKARVSDPRPSTVRSSYESSTTIIASEHQQVIHSDYIEEDELLFDPEILEEESDHPTASQAPAPIFQPSIENSIELLDANSELAPLPVLNKEQQGSWEEEKVVAHVDAWSKSNIVMSESTSSRQPSTQSAEWGTVAAEIQAKNERETKRREMEKMISAQSQQEALRHAEAYRQAQQQRSMTEIEKNEKELKAEEELILQKQKVMERIKREEEEKLADIANQQASDFMLLLDDDADHF